MPKYVDDDKLKPILEGAITLIEDIRKLNDSEFLKGELKAYQDVLNGIDDIPEAKPEPRWIPVTEKLPKEKELRYWVCTDTGYQCQCRWTNVNPIWVKFTTDWHWNIFDIPQYSRVIAWRQLPEPYEEETE